MMRGRVGEGSGMIAWRFPQCAGRLAPPPLRLWRPAQGCEGEAMERRRAASRKRFKMNLRPVADMARKAIVRIKRVETGHHPVARDLGDNRGGGDRETRGVALDDRAPLAAKARRPVAAVDECESRTQRQSVDGARHRRKRRAANIEKIDLLGAGEGDRNAQRL